LSFGEAEALIKTEGDGGEKNGQTDLFRLPFFVRLWPA